MIRGVFAVIALIAAGCGRPAAIALPEPSPASPSTPAALESRIPDAPRADSLQRELDGIFNAPAFDRAIWGVAVRRISDGKTLYSLNAAKLMMPGSALKLATAAAAADVLGWDHVFETRVAATAPLDGTTLRGDLLVIGGGDPSISERTDSPGVLSRLARDVRAAGVTKIEGGIIGHDDALDDRRYGDGWTLDNLPYGYAAGVSALQYNDGSIDLVITAGPGAGEPVGIQVRPAGSGLTVVNRLTTVAESGTGRLTLTRLPGSQQLTVEGQIPARTPPFVRTASVDNPTMFFAAAFRGALLAEGVQVAGDAADIDDFLMKPDITSARTLATVRSQPLRDLVGAMMRVSQNQYAEILFKAAGGRNRIRESLAALGVPADSCIMADGSGLSRYSFVSAEALVNLLSAMKTSERHGEAFLATLALAGKDGTLARRLAGTSAAGRVRAKTGTIDHARTIAGYLETSGGDTLAFAIIANNFTLPNAEVDAAADAAILRLVEAPTR